MSFPLAKNILKKDLLLKRMLFRYWSYGYLLECCYVFYNKVTRNIMLKAFKYFSFTCCNSFALGLYNTTDIAEVLGHLLLFTTDSVLNLFNFKSMHYLNYINC